MAMIFTSNDKGYLGSYLIKGESIDLLIKNLAEKLFSKERNSVESGFWLKASNLHLDDYISNKVYRSLDVIYLYKRLSVKCQKKYAKDVGIDVLTERDVWMTSYIEYLNTLDEQKYLYLGKIFFKTLVVKELLKILVRFNKQCFNKILVDLNRLINVLINVYKYHCFIDEEINNMYSDLRTYY